MSMRAMTAMQLSGRRVLIRLELNAPLADGKITSSKRIDESLATIRHCIDAGAKTLLMSHLGRPREGHPAAQFSLAPIAEYLGDALGMRVPLCVDYLRAPIEVDDGCVALLENVRFNRGESENDSALARRYAALCDVYVMDAFGAAHRAHASTEGVARYAPLACAGPLLLGELDALHAALQTPRRPLLAIVGGAKVSGKLRAIESLLDKVDHLIPGGGIANTFLAAAGAPIGNSLHEPELIEVARGLMQKAAAADKVIALPTDVVVAANLSRDAKAAQKLVQLVGVDESIYDIGAQTIAAYQTLIRNAATIVWNGPLGVFEIDAFAAGTRAVGDAVAAADAYTIAGGGDTIAAIERFGLSDKIANISTGGGAFLAVVEGKPLPAVQALVDAARN